VVYSFKNKDDKELEVKIELRFIDSFRFMSSSLDSLVKTLNKDQFKNTSKFYEGEQLSLLLKKGVYPYEYMDTVVKLNESSLPAKDKFFSQLSGSNISDEDYTHAQNVWRAFNCQTLKDYHNLYNKSDVLLLADIFENFRDVCSQNYKLDPLWYLTAPGLAWDAALKLTDIRLELISDYDMLLMVQKGIRGGVSMVSQRMARANNEYLGEGKYNRTEPSSHIVYLDCNSLYAGSMRSKLPTHDFKWMEENE
jgi:hypothetical protein